METNAKPMTVGGFLIKLLQGVLIGLGAVLPGISGGVLCVVFGVYAPIMALLSNPFRAFKRYALTLLPSSSGWESASSAFPRCWGFCSRRIPTHRSACLSA